MSVCHVCHRPFAAASAAWGDETCGDCIAATIELGLVGALLDSQRRPAMRMSAASPGATLEDLAVELKRRVGNG